MNIKIAIGLCLMAGCALSDTGPVDIYDDGAVEVPNSVVELNTNARGVSAESTAESMRALIGPAQPQTTCGWLTDLDNCYVLNQGSWPAQNEYCEHQCGSFFSYCQHTTVGKCDILNGEPVITKDARGMQVVSPTSCYIRGKCIHQSGQP